VLLGQLAPWCFWASGTKTLVILMGHQFDGKKMQKFGMFSNAGTKNK
jgi:hypothetical protein